MIYRNSIAVRQWSKSKIFWDFTMESGKQCGIILHVERKRQQTTSKDLNDFPNMLSPKIEILKRLFYFDIVIKLLKVSFTHSEF